MGTPNHGRNLPFFDDEPDYNPYLEEEEEEVTRDMTKQPTNIMESTNGFGQGDNEKSTIQRVVMQNPFSMEPVNAGMSQNNSYHRNQRNPRAFYNPQQQNNMDRNYSRSIHRPNNNGHNMSHANGGNYNRSHRESRPPVSSNEVGNYGPRTYSKANNRPSQVKGVQNHSHFNNHGYGKRDANPSEAFSRSPSRRNPMDHVDQFQEFRSPLHRPSQPAFDNAALIEVASKIQLDLEQLNNIKQGVELSKQMEVSSKSPEKNTSVTHGPHGKAQHNQMPWQPYRNEQVKPRPQNMYRSPLWQDPVPPYAGPVRHIPVRTREGNHEMTKTYSKHTRDRVSRWDKPGFCDPSPSQNDPRLSQGRLHPGTKEFGFNVGQTVNGAPLKGILKKRPVEDIPIPGLNLVTSTPDTDVPQRPVKASTVVRNTAESDSLGSEEEQSTAAKETPLTLRQSSEENNVGICMICTSYPSNLVEHCVNCHPGKEVPCKLSKKALQIALQDSDGKGTDLDGADANMLNPMEDLSWLPNGDVFKKAVQCKYCPVESILRRFMLDHLKSHVGKVAQGCAERTNLKRVACTDLSCRLCEYETPNMAEFREHVSGHTGEFAYTCCYCTFQFPTVELAKSHILIQHTSKAFKIKTNEARMKTDGTLQGHVCTVCGYVQFDANTVKAHTNMEHRKMANARVVTINMSKTAYKLVPAESVPEVADEKSKTKAEPKPCNQSPTPESSVAASLGSNKPVLTNETSDLRQANEQPRSGRVVGMKLQEETTSCEDRKVSEMGGSGTSSVTVPETRHPEVDSPLRKDAAPIVKAAPAMLDDTVAKLRAQLVKDGAPLGVADIDTMMERAVVNTASYREKLQSWISRERAYICGVPCCVSVFTSEEAFIAHRDYMHKDITMAPCRECDLTLPSVTEFLKHLRGPAHVDHKRKFVCSAETVCHFTTVSGKIFIEHVNKKHQDKALLSCFWCSRKVMTSHTLAEHIEFRCSVQKKLIASYIKNGLNSVPGVITDTEDEDTTSRERDAKRFCHDREPSQSGPSVCLDQDEFQKETALGKRRSSEDDGSSEKASEERATKKLKVYGKAGFTVLQKSVTVPEKKRDVPTAVTMPVGGSGARSPNKVPNITSAPYKDSVRKEIQLESAADKSQPLNTAISIKPRLSATSKPGLTTSAEVDGPKESSAPLLKVQKNTESWLQISSVVSLASVNAQEPRKREADVNDAGVKNLATMDTADMYSALAEACTLVTVEDFAPGSLKTDKNRAILLKAAEDVKPEAVFSTLHKTRNSLSAMLSEASLRHLYKCAGRHCSYTTDDEKNFWHHMSEAKKAKDRICVYCFQVFDRPEMLIHHVRDTHAKSTYVCTHCFYRAKTKMTMLLHIHIHHDQAQGRSFIVLAAGEGQKDEVVQADDVLKTVKPFVCGQELCSFATLEEEDLTNHLRSAHVALKQSKCFYCGESLDVGTLTLHLKEHNVMRYHCLVCGWGTDDDSDSMKHMCEKHPERSGSLYIRGACASKMFQAAISLKSSQRIVRRINEPPKVNTAIVDKGNDEGANIVENVDISKLPGSGREKYKCGYSHCDFSTQDVTKLESHMKMCYLINKGHSLECPNCKAQFSDHAAYSAHVPTHDVRRYSCGLCNFRTQLPHYIKRHMRSYHRSSFEDMICIRLNQSADLDSDEFMYVQKGTVGTPRNTQESRNAAPLTSHQGNPTRVECVEQVPMQSIFQKEMMCSWCDFSTKVRLNLIRHLEKHKSQSIILTQAPTAEPVPEPDLVPEVSVPEFEVPPKKVVRREYAGDHPQFVPDNELYRCSISGCHYLAMDRSLYELHINTLHGNSRILPCPHCHEKPHTVAMLIRHLRLHGSKLFRCNECNFLGMSRQSIKTHSVVTHGAFDSYTVIREGELEAEDVKPLERAPLYSAQGGETDSAPRLSRTGKAAKVMDVVWECGVCDMKMASRMEVKRHLADIHLLTVLYRCTLCKHGERTHAEVARHFAERHAGAEVKVEDLVRWRVRGERTITRKPQVKRKIQAAEMTAASPEKRFTCYLCHAYKSHYKADLRIHIFREMGYAKYKCGYCQVRYFSQKDATRHSLQVHRKQPPKVHAEVDEEFERDVNERLNAMPDAESAVENVEPHKVDSFEMADPESPEVEETPGQAQPGDYMYKCPTCRYKTSAKSAVRKHLLRHLQYRPYRCGHCGARFPKPKQCLRHHDSQHEGLAVEIENDVDKRCLKFVSLVLNAMDTTLRNNDLSDSPLIAGNAWKCSYDGCTAKMQSLKALLDHFSGHVLRSAFRCGLCPFSGNARSTVEAHCRTAHDGQMSVVEGDLRPGTSNLPGEGSPLDEGLADGGNTGSTYECPFCPYRDLFAGNVTRHALRHYDFRFYSCGHCGTECLEPCDVEDHSRSEHPNLQVVVKKIKRPETLMVCNEQPRSHEGYEDRFFCCQCEYKTMDLSCIQFHCKEAHDPLSIYLCRKAKEGEEDEEEEDSLPLAVRLEVKTAVVQRKDVPSPGHDKNDGGNMMDVNHFCSYCEYVTDSHPDLESHWLARHHELPFISSVPQPTYQCPQCEFTSLVQEQVKKHVTQHLKRYVCQRCGREVHTFQEGVQHSKKFHPNVVLELIPHPKGTENAIRELVNGIKVVPSLSRQTGEGGSGLLALALTPVRSGRKVAKKQHRSSNAPPSLPKNSSAGTAQGETQRKKTKSRATPKPTEQEMDRITVRIRRDMKMKMKGVVSLRQLCRKVKMFPNVAVARLISRLAT